MKAVKILGLAIFLFGFAGIAAAQKVQVDVDNSVNFSNFKTYGWVDGQIARNPVVAELIKQAITSELTSRGLSLAADNPDLSVSVMAATDMDLQGVGPTWNNERYRFWGGYANPAALMNVSSGTLLVDLVENKNKMSIWRGVARKTLNSPASGDIAKDAKSVEKLIKKSVQKMFAKYPVGKS